MPEAAPSDMSSRTIMSAYRKCASSGYFIARWNSSNFALSQRPATWSCSLNTVSPTEGLTSWIRVSDLCTYLLRANLSRAISMWALGNICFIAEKRCCVVVNIPWKCVVPSAPFSICPSSFHPAGRVNVYSLSRGLFIVTDQQVALPHTVASMRAPSDIGAGVILTAPILICLVCLSKTYSRWPESF